MSFLGHVATISNNASSELAVLVATLPNLAHAIPRADGRMAACHEPLGREGLSAS
jgi:hypothetical protein